MNQKSALYIWYRDQREEDCNIVWAKINPMEVLVVHISTFVQEHPRKILLLYTLGKINKKLEVWLVKQTKIIEISFYEKEKKN